MKNRLLATLALLLFAVVCLAIQQAGRTPSTMGAVSGFAISDPHAASAAMSSLPGELLLVKTPDSEFLTEPMASNPPDDQVAEAAVEPANRVATASESDGKESKEIVAVADGKESKEMIDPKGLPPIAEGGATEDGAGGGGGGAFGGGGGGGSANEVVAFHEVREVEGEGDTIINNAAPIIINRTTVRTVPQAAPVIPVPEPGNALVGFGVAAVIIAWLLRRQRQSDVA